MRVVGENISVETHHLSQLIYIKMVINEALRLFPPGCYIGRKTTDDIDLGKYNRFR